MKLKNRIRLFCSDYSDDLRDDSLSENDWNHLAEIADGLQPFHEAALVVEGNAGQGHHGAVWEVLPTLEALLSAMEDGQKRVNEAGRGTSPLAVAYQNAWEKLNKYYNITDDSHSIYAAATLFNPTCRKAYYDKQWITPDMKMWKDKMIAKVRQVWEEDYKGNTPTEARKPPKEPDFLKRYLNRNDEDQGDEFDCYIKGSTVMFPNNDDEDLLNWWAVSGPPQLRQQAFDLLSIPAMSAEVERVFSSAKRTISADRHRLNDDTIEYLELLKYWWSRGLATQIRRKR